MKNCYFEVKKGQCGFLTDGRYYKVISVPSIMMCSDGTLKHGDVELDIDGENYIIRISEFIDNVKTVGNLTVR